MSEARARAEARKKKILERGSDRMAIATGQKASTGSTSWRKKRPATTATTTATTATSEEEVKVSELSVEIEAEGIDSTHRHTPLVMEVDTSKDTSKDSSSDVSNSVNVDQDLDDIVDSIDLSKLIPKEDIKEKEKEESSKRVLSAVKDYNPVEREKSIAKRKALEQEIVRQTEEFDRLAEITRKKKETGMTKSKEDKTKTATTCVSTGSHSSETSITSRKSKLSKSDWLRIIRCMLLTSLGVCVGYWSYLDTAHIWSQHSTSIEQYLSSHTQSANPNDLLQKFANEQDGQSYSQEIVATILPTVWRENSSYLYVLLHFPVIVVGAIMVLSKFLVGRLMIVDAVVAGDNKQGGILASVLSVAMGDFSGITKPLSAFVGDCCLYCLIIFITAALCEQWKLSSAELPGLDRSDLGNEF